MRAKCRSFQSPLPKVIEVRGPDVRLRSDLDSEDLFSPEPKTAKGKRKD